MTTTMDSFCSPTSSRFLSTHFHTDYDTPDERLSISESDTGAVTTEYSHCPDRFRSPTTWSQRLAAVTSFFPSGDKEADGDAFPLLPLTTQRTKHFSPRLKKLKLFRFLLFPIVGFFVMLGIIQFISIACGIAISFFPGEFDKATDSWLLTQDVDLSADIFHWPTDISRDIVPVSCHSHNDYWRRVPLFSALQAGCIGVEADVWLMDNELYVGHTTSSLTPKRTLRNMYIDPLLRILDKQNPITQFHPTLDKPLHGVFDTDPSQTLVLLIDFKTDGEKTWKQLMQQLTPLRERGYLTYFNGTDLVNSPVTVVGTGNAPFSLVTSNSTYRDIFFDAPLDKLVDDNNGRDKRVTSQKIATTRSTKNAGQGLSGVTGDIGPDAFDSTNSFYASVSFKKSIGIPWRLHLTDHQIDIMRAQIRAAHRRGLKVRYWGVPSWPRSLRNHIWNVLIHEGVDMLNVDDLQSATQQDWKPKVFAW